jgi:predicted Zn-dependent protease
MVAMKWAITVLLGTALMAASGPAAAADSNANAQEDQIGRQVYAQLQQKGEIIRSSPLYNVLEPIAQQIKRVADPQYYRPFTFILVHEQQPNAFAVPGGNVFVTDSLMRFVENREELAGVLCHETSHDIHHDVMNNIARDQRAEVNTTIGATIANILTGGRAAGIINTAANINLMAAVNGYSREVETAADLKGADTCAQAGSNPWGMIWLFEKFGKSNSGGQMEMLSDHPRDDHRIADLQAHFRQHPELFAKYSSDMHGAQPLNVPRNSAATHEDQPSAGN